VMAYLRSNVDMSSPAEESVRLIIENSKVAMLSTFECSLQLYQLGSPGV
jgi:hypothetical protein